MALLPIRTYPDPVLRQRCARIESFDEALRRLAADMIETMHVAPGVGLAAPQVGVPLRLTVVDPTGGKDAQAIRVLVNPQIVASSGNQVDSEGCLSLPDFSDKVERPERVTLVASDLEGRPFELSGEGFLARILCHEVDHLDGVLFVDRLRGLRRERARRHLKRLLRKGETAECVAES